MKINRLHLLFILGILSFCSCEKDGIEGSFTDARDGQVYPTISIGNQVWMAENLRYDVPNKWTDDTLITIATISRFSDTMSIYSPEVYGRLYDYETVKTVCPTGWHLPTIDEWSTFDQNIGLADDIRSATGWYSYNGNNSRGFNAYPAGIYTNGFGQIEKATYFWSASSDVGNSVYTVILKESNTIAKAYNGRLNAFSCRCLQD